MIELISVFSGVSAASIPARWARLRREVPVHSVRLERHYRTLKWSATSEAETTAQCALVCRRACGRRCNPRRWLRSSRRSRSRRSSSRAGTRSRVRPRRACVRNQARPPLRARQSGRRGGSPSLAHDQLLVPVAPEAGTAIPRPPKKFRACSACYRLGKRTQVQERERAVRGCKSAIRN